MRNPWMSMWLSGANAWAGAARGMMTAEMRKTQNAMIKEASKQAVAFWTPEPAPKAAPKRKSRAARRK